MGGFGGYTVHLIMTHFNKKCTNVVGRNNDLRAMVKLPSEIFIIVDNFPPALCNETRPY